MFDMPDVDMPKVLVKISKAKLHPNTKTKILNVFNPVNVYQFGV